MLAPKLNFLFNEHAGIPIFKGGGLFVSAIDFSMSLAGRVHISVWELSTLNLLRSILSNLLCNVTWLTTPTNARLQNFLTTILGCGCTRVQ